MKMNSTIQRNDDTGDFKVLTPPSFTESAMIAFLESDAEPADLSRAAEDAGCKMGGERIVTALLKLLKHPRPVVREGALYGLWYHMSNKDVREAVIKVAKEDECASIRDIADDLEFTS